MNVISYWMNWSDVKNIYIYHISLYFFKKDIFILKRKDINLTHSHGFYPQIALDFLFYPVLNTPKILYYLNGIGKMQDKAGNWKMGLQFEPENELMIKFCQKRTHSTCILGFMMVKSIIRIISTVKLSFFLFISGTWRQCDTIHWLWSINASQCRRQEACHKAKRHFWSPTTKSWRMTSSQCWSILRRLSN